MSTAPAPRHRLRMDMHLHTRHSFDCLSRPEEILRVARERGLDRLIVTDHNEIRGALELREMDPERVLVGEEVKTREGFDLIGILLRERIPKGTPAREACERIRDQGGVVYIPHPFDLARAGAGAHLDSLGELVDVVEVHNARCWVPAFNRRAAEWAAAHARLAGAGSDAHTVAELGRGCVEVPPFEPTRDGLLAALSAGRLGECTRSSPLVRLGSTYAKLRKKLPGGSTRS
jgi:predicted metal-dependent phosphoesterase TrpH